MTIATAGASDPPRPDPIVAAVPKALPPLYSRTMNGVAAGLAVDVFNDIAGRANLTVVYRVLDSWDDVREALESGTADVVPLMEITNQTAPFARFTRPLEQYDVVMVRRVENTELTGLSDLSGRVVGVVRTALAVPVLAGRPKLFTRPYTDEKRGLDALLQGGIDVLVIPEPAFLKLARAVRVQDQVRSFGPPLATVERAIAVRKTDPALLARLDAVVGDYVGSADHVALQEKWGDDGRGKPPLFMVAWIAVLIISALVVTIAIWKARHGPSAHPIFFSETDGRALGVRLRRLGLVLTAILVLSIAAIAGSTLTLLYGVAFEKQRERLVEMVRSQARLMQAMATFDERHATYPGGSTAATLQQIRAGLSSYPGIGEFTLARRVEDSIVFIVRQRAWDRYQPSPIPLDSDLAEPMRQALLGQSGTLIGKDYRGVTVLAAFAPVPILNLGVVAKVDIHEIRAPFIEAGLTTAAIGVLVIVLGTTGFVTVGDPLVRQLVERERWFAAIIQHAGVGIALIDVATGRIVNANDRYAAILKRAPDTPGQQPFMDTLDAFEAPSMTRDLGRMVTGEITRFTTEGRLQSRDQAVAWVKLTASATWKTGERPARLVLVVDDITERKQAEETVNKFFDQPMNLHLIAGMDGIIHRVNAGWERTLGYPPDQLVGRAFMDMVHPDDVDASRAEMDRLRRGDITYGFENRYRHRSGEYRWLVWSAIAATNEDRLFAVASDITDRKISEDSLRKSEETFEWFLDVIDDVVWLGSENHLEFISNSCERIFGYPKETFLHDPTIWVRAIHPDDRAAVQADLGGTRTPGTLHQQYRILRADGSVRWLDDRRSFELDADGQITRMGGVTTDITKRKALETDLAEKTKTLEESNNDLQQFAHIASHDLREPLRMVASFMQLLERNYAESLDDRAREYIGFAVNGAKRMDALITDLLSFSRVQSHGRAMTAVDSDALLKEALENLAPRITEAAATIDHTSLPRVLADGPQLIQVFQNLVGNALKYRAPDRPVTIRIGATQSDQIATFTVRDTGIGIDPQYHDQIFRIFQRLHGREAYGGGTGVGLAVCKRIVDRHGGRIWVDSAPGQGSTFAFTLPLAP